ncbi:MULTISPECIES: Bax inhibitor-1 family protein [unclassified Pedobacter]|uniref:Bax inhibitor-1/YccA family protein n=1 Tax=unclassified Pedobacter TaxID=2628915 RepID=UPI002246F5CE|nr:MULTISPECIES: Bax inhibitor-1/YccA family protein [unclassified Pedobacter]MCX2432854.1 Bax inhibitor-1/YccA family protein [Pedobacter sp. GR22-10]MCX2586072.1 Bax inhibitor-1/YccA family protein [Pedobacter sp. MR22-3]
MEQQNYQYQGNSVFVQENTVSKKFFASVFLWMFVALLISSASAFVLANSPGILSYLVAEKGFTIFGYIAIFAPLGLVMLMGAAMQRLSFPALVGIFLLYSLLTGVMLGFILLIYTTTSIAICFVAAAVIFAVMAIMGYTTDVDLSKFGPILMAGVIGLVIVSLINFFIGSETLNYILGFVGVAIFTALTAYKVQEIKRIGEGLDESGNEIALADSKKLAIMGALSLYITFINLFVSLLRLFGSRR